MWTKEISEFVKCNLTPEYLESFYAPFDKESNLKIALGFIENIPIKLNHTELLIGKIKHIILSNSRAIKEDGQIELSTLDTITVCGLNSYYITELIKKLSYAKV